MVQAVASVDAWTLERITPRTVEAGIGALVRRGLTASPKSLPPVLLYDARGSRLFDSICDLDEYYVTRTERALLAEHATDIAAHLSGHNTVIELGSGSSEKTEILLGALLADGAHPRYVPVDISESALVDAAERLTRDLPEVRLSPVVASYEDALESVVARNVGSVALVFLGSNLGNLSVAEAGVFLRSARASAGDDAQLLLGLDLVKPLDVLLPAYDDRRGVTAEFNRNLLYRINRELRADFFPAAFAHEARWNQSMARVEMHLRSLGRQRVRIEELDLDVELAAGETIHTESSHKYTTEAIAALANQAGWRVRRRWLDPQHYFSLNLLEAVA